MAAFFLRRFLALVLVLFTVVTITFFMLRLAPGGPFDRERKIPERIERELKLKYNLEGPEGRAWGEAFAARLGLGAGGKTPSAKPVRCSSNTGRTWATSSTATCGFPRNI